MKLSSFLRWCRSLATACVLGLAVGGRADAATNRVDWFVDARFGMFIHWSAGSIYGAHWQGEPFRGPGAYGEWTRCRNRVNRSDYDAALPLMSATPDQIEQWVALAKEAGMQYIVFVAKHHDGLAFWPSQASAYNLPKLNGTGTDILRCLKTACDNYGLKLGFYYSQWHDWDHPGGWGNFWDFEQARALTNYPSAEWNHLLNSGALVRPSLKPEQFAAYWREKALPQVAELITNYHPALLWFDCWLPREQTILTEAQVTELLTLIRRLDSNCLVNTRLAVTNVGPAGVDFQSMDDNEFPGTGPAHPWETSATFGRTWGYNRDDLAWKPTTFFVRELVGNISKGGNLQLNIGPRADGSLPPEAVNRLKEIGRCVRVNADGFQGCGPTPMSAVPQDWGKFTGRVTPEGKHLLYAHVFEWPPDGLVRVTGLRTSVRAAKSLAGEPISYGQLGACLRLQGPRTEPSPYDSVIELELDGPAEADAGFVSEVNGGGWHINPASARLTGGLTAVAADLREGTPARIQGWTNATDIASWKVFVPEAGTKEVRICYACPVSLAGQEFSVRIGERVWHAKTMGTHADWREYRTFVLGDIQFPEPGDYQVSVSPVNGPKDGLFRLAWLFLK